MAIRSSVFSEARLRVFFFIICKFQKYTNINNCIDFLPVIFILERNVQCLYYGKIFIFKIFNTSVNIIVISRNKRGSTLVCLIRAPEGLPTGLDPSSVVAPRLRLGCFLEGLSWGRWQAPQDRYLCYFIIVALNNLSDSSWSSLSSISAPLLYASGKALTALVARQRRS